MRFEFSLIFKGFHFSHSPFIVKGDIDQSYNYQTVLIWILDTLSGY